MLEPALIYEKRGEIAYLTFNRPAVRKIKETVLRSLSVSLGEGFALETKNAQVVLTTEDAKEGPRAFMEKRKPRYIGR